MFHWSSMLPWFIDGLRLNLSAFALHGVHVASAAPVIDTTKKANVKMPIALKYIFMHYNSSIVSTQSSTFQIFIFNY